MANIVRYGTGRSALGFFVVALSERGLAMVERALLEREQSGGLLRRLAVVAHGAD